MFGTLGVNLPHLPHLPPPSKRAPYIPTSGVARKINYLGQTSELPRAAQVLLPPLPGATAPGYAVDLEMDSERNGPLRLWTAARLEAS
jgi:hypothetical protein